MPLLVISNIITNTKLVILDTCEWYNTAIFNCRTNRDNTDASTDNVVIKHLKTLTYSIILTKYKYHLLKHQVISMHSAYLIFIVLDMFPTEILEIYGTPDRKVHGANMGPTWVLSAPDGPHVGPMNFAIRDHMQQ